MEFVDWFLVTVTGFDAQTVFSGLASPGFPFCHHFIFTFAIWFVCYWLYSTWLPGFVFVEQYPHHSGGFVSHGNEHDIGWSAI